MTLPTKKLTAPITIVLTSYNYSQYILDAIRSVLEQTSPEWNLLICDNQSTDNTVELLQPFLEDERISLVIRPENIGFRKNVAFGVDAVETEFVSHLQADDFLEPTFVDVAINMLRKHKEAPFVFFNWQHFIDETKQGAYHNTFPFSSYRSGPMRIGPFLTVGNFVPLHMAVFRTHLYKDKARMMLDTPLAQVGEQYLLKVLEDEHGYACYSGVLGGYWRRHGRQITAEHLKTSVAGIEEAVERQWYITRAHEPDPCNAFLCLVGFVRLSSHASYTACVDWVLSEAGTSYAESLGIPVREEADRFRNMALLVALKFSTYTGMQLTNADDLACWLAKIGCQYTKDNLRAKLHEIMKREGDVLINDAEVRGICDYYFTSDKPRFLVLSVDETAWACSQIRLLQPFAHHLDDFELVWGVRAEGGAYFTDLELLRTTSVVIIQRIYAQNNHKAYLDLIFNLGIPVVYEIDDLMFDLPPDNPHYEEIMRHRGVILDVIRRADAVTVSCPVLAEEIRPYAKKVYVLPNLVKADLFKAQVPPSREMVTLGVLGTPTHASDFAIIEEVIRHLLDRFPDRLNIICMGYAAPRWIGHPAVTLVPFEFEYKAYAARLRSLGLDIALIPLEDNRFNRAKSNIKWLEYSAAGIAGVFSDLPPYDAVCHGETGLKVGNTTEAWFSAVSDLIDHPEKRIRIATAAQREVLANWSVAARASEYAKAYREILHSGRDAPSKEGVVETMIRPGYDPVRFYQLWQQAHQPNPREAAWIGERIEALSSRPIFHLAVIVPPRRENDLARIISSLATQLHTEWQLTVIATIASPEGLEAFPRLHWIEAPGVNPLETVNRYLNETEADWVGMVEAGDGLSVHALFALADAIDRHREWQAVYTDEDELDAEGTRQNPLFKPDFNLDMLRSTPRAVGGLLLLRRGLFARLGGFRPTMDGVENYDLTLRVCEALKVVEFGHVADVLYHRYVGGGHCPRSAEELQAARDTALVEHFERLGVAADVGRGLLPDTYRVMYRYPDKPRVSIIIPSRNQVDMLRRCMTSLFEQTAWPDYEVLIVDNGSDEPSALDYLEVLRQHPGVRVIPYPHAFNFAAMNNLAAREASGEYLLLLNNDTAVLHGDWLDEMMSHARRSEVGIVGARLLFPDGKLQHAGVVLGLAGRPAEHAFLGQGSDMPGYAGRALMTQDYSAVTAACLLLRRSVYEAVGGLDEERFKVSYNDVDLCLKVREQGLLVVWTPYAMLLHEGSVSQRGGVEMAESAERRQRFHEEQDAFYDKWRRQVAHDPAYNRNLSFADRDFKIEIAPTLTLDPDWRPRPRILAHAADRMGCGEYRIAAPMRALNGAGRVMGWDTGNYLGIPDLFRFEPDSIVLQRQVEADQIELIERYVRHAKAFRVFEIDDLITDVPVKSPRKHLFVEMKDLHQRFRKAVSLCHRFVVSTDYLAEEYRGYADEVIAVPNYLERLRWGNFSPLRRQGRKPRVGWAGSATHDGDLLEIVDTVQATAEEVDWVFFGMCPAELRASIREFHPPVPLEEYPAKLASLNLDLAVAPLEDVPFNHAKSHLRLLEYGVLGYPVICTDITPYRGDYPVTRVPNRYKDWVAAIREHVSDLDALARRGDALRDHVNRHWILEDNLDTWLKAWLPS